MSGESNSVNSSLESILRGSLLFVLGKIAANAAGFLLNLVLVHALGTALYGIYAYGRLITATSLTMTLAGMDKGMLKYIPVKSDEKERNQVVTVGVITALAFGLFVGVCIYVFAPVITAYTLENELLTDVLRILAVTVPFYTLSNLIGSVFRSIEAIGHDVAISKISPRVARLLAAICGLLLGYGLVRTTLALMAASGLVLFVALTLFLTRTDFSPDTKVERETVFELYNFSFPLMFSRAGTFLYKRIDVFMIGIFLTSTDVGLYNIAVLVSSVLVLPLNGISQLFPPIASELYANDKIAELQSVYSVVTRWSFTVSLFVATLLVVHRTAILSLFSEEVAAATLIFAILILGQLANAVAGPCNYVMMMTDHQYITMVNQWVFGVSNVILNYLLLQEIGILGAAIATATSLTLLNATRVVEVWYLEGLVPYSWKFAKPLLACGLAVVPMVLFESWLDGLLQLFASGLVSGVVFASLLYAFGIEKEDRSFIEEEVVG